MKGKAEEVEKISKEAFEEEKGRGSLREREGDKGRVWLWCVNALILNFPPV